MTSRSAPGPQRSKNASTTGETFQDASSHPMPVTAFAFFSQRLSLQISLELFKTSTLAVFSVCGCADVYFSGGVCLQTQAYLLEGSPEWSRLERLEYLFGRHNR